MDRFKKIRKTLAFVGYHCFAIFLPVSYTPVFGKLGKKIRGFLGRQMLDSCGTNVNIEKGAKFSTKSTLGNDSGIGINATLGIVHIGDHVLMGRDCIGITRNHQFMDKTQLIAQQGYTQDEPIIIGNDVWLGHRVTILPGVHIADGCVIGAGSVVTKSTEAYGVYAGNPAKKIKERT